MSNYTKSTNFATKDTLTSGDPLKIVKGTELNTEFDNISTAIATKADTASPTFTGTVTIPTLSVSGTSTLTSNPVLSAGTINGVTYLNGSKSLTSGSALTFDGTDFATTGTATATKLIPTGSSVTGNGLYLPAANSLGLSTNGTNAVYINSSQNVGIGITSPASRFQVAGGRTLLCANSETFSLGVNYSSSTGSYYIGATNSATPDLVFSQVGGSERLRLTDAGNLLFNSGYGSVATAYGCRAWGNFTGVASVSIRASGNVSSIAYTSAGKYTVNLTTTLVDANYALSLGCCGLGSSAGGKLLLENSSGTGGTIGRTSSAFVLISSYSFSNPGGGTDDNSYSNSFAVFR